MSTARLVVMVSGMVAGDAHQGGATWAVLQYVAGLRELGHDVVLVEPVPEFREESTQYATEVMAGIGFDQWALLEQATQRTAGLDYSTLRDLASRADVLLNVSGMLTDETLLEHIPVRVYLDLDPAFIQLWHEIEGIDMRFEGHTHFVTVGTRIGDADCAIPTCGRTWLPTLPPVVLSEWPVADALVDDAFTTVANWRGYGSVAHDGVFYGQKAHSVRNFIELPRHTSERVRFALAIHPDETGDLEALRENDWELVDPREVAGTPASYRSFVRGSKAELGITKSGYVVSRSGWFSDRSACYLASGRPVVAQDTGFGDRLPTGDGLFAFAHEEDVLAAIDSIASDYAGHRVAARAIAEEHFDSEKVLTSLLDRVLS